MVHFRFCRCYETRLRSCLGWVGVNVLVSEGAGMNQLFLPVKTSENEKARKKGVKTHRLFTKSHCSSCRDCRRNGHLGTCSL